MDEEGLHRHYSDEDICKIADAISLLCLQPETIDKLERTADSYKVLLFSYEYSLRRKEKRLILAKMAISARFIAQSWKNFDACTIHALPALNVTPDELKTFALKTIRKANRLPRRGANPKMARLKFIEEVAHLFVELTGKEPTRSVDPTTSKERGQFRTFVVAALEPLDKDALKGVNHGIRQVIEERAGKGRQPSREA